MLIFNLLRYRDIDEKCKIYQDYIDTVIDLSKEKRYIDCDSNGILKVLYMKIDEN